MNKERFLDIIASIVVFVGKFIVTPIFILIVIVALWSVGIEIQQKHIPLKHWLMALAIVSPVFGGIYLLSWATVRREDKRWHNERKGVK